MSILKKPRTTIPHEAAGRDSRAARAERDEGRGGDRVAPSAVAIVGVLVVGVLVVMAVIVYGYSLVRLATGSMSPSYPQDSVLLVRDVPAADVRAGDVVTVSRDGTVPITHRVVTTEPGDGEAVVLVLRGDANSANDPDPYRVDRVGLVLAGLPFGGKVLVAMQSPLGLGIASIVVALLVLWAWWPRRERGAHVEVN